MNVLVLICDTPIRDLAVTCPAFGEFPNSGNCRITLTTDAWTLILPTARRDAELYSLALDPGQTLNVIGRHRDLARGIHDRFLELLEQLDADPAKIESWRDAL